MVKNPERVLFRLAAGWTAIGLAGGLAYRELTHSAHYTGFTQLGLFHTHTLVLGTLVGLGLLALQRSYSLSDDRRFGWFLWTWNIGLALTAVGLAVKGTMQVLDSPAADSPALAGMSGTGHILLTIGFLLLFLVLGRRIRVEAADPGAAEREAPTTVEVLS